jgi:hypothetical protein
VVSLGLGPKDPFTSFFPSPSGYYGYDGDDWCAMASAVSTVISSNDHAGSYISATTVGVKDGSALSQQEVGDKELNKEKGVDVAEVPVPWTDDEIVYPDGGLRAWLVVAGVCSVML